MCFSLQFWQILNKIRMEIMFQDKMSTQKINQDFIRELKIDMILFEGKKSLKS